jgi:hypothetical protein
MTQSSNIKIEKFQTIEHLLQALPSLTTNLPPETRILLMAGTPCQKISKGTLINGSATTKIGLHAPPSNLIWEHYHILYDILHHEHNFITQSFYEQVIPHDPNISEEIAKHFGLPHFCENHKYGGAYWNRQYYI